MNGLEWIKDLGPTAGVIVAVLLFLRYSGQMRDAFLELISNHLAHSTEAIHKLEQAIDALRAEVIEHHR